MNSNGIRNDVRSGYDNAVECVNLTVQVIEAIGETSRALVRDPTFASGAPLAKAARTVVNLRSACEQAKGLTRPYLTDWSELLQPLRVEGVNFDSKRYSNWFCVAVDVAAELLAKIEQHHGHRIEHEQALLQLTPWQDGVSRSAWTSIVDAMTRCDQVPQFDSSGALDGLLEEASLLHERLEEQDAQMTWYSAADIISTFVHQQSLESPTRAEVNAWLKKLRPKVAQKGSKDTFREDHVMKLLNDRSYVVRDLQVRAAH